jgi:predicted DNA-binding transcriptional regulator AlpA
MKTATEPAPTATRHRPHLSHPEADRLLQPRAARELLGGISNATLWKLAKSRDFPIKIQISLKSVGWWESELRRWVESRRVR